MHGVIVDGGRGVDLQAGDIDRALEEFAMQREVKRLAEAHIGDLETRMREMRAVMKTLRELASHCHGDDRSECPILDDLATPKPQKRRRATALSYNPSGAVRKASCASMCSASGPLAAAMCTGCAQASPVRRDDRPQPEPTGLVEDGDRGHRRPRTDEWRGSDDRYTIRRHAPAKATT